MSESPNHLKLALIAITAISLAACGSGGSDLISYSAPTFSAGFISISVQENTTGVIYTAQATDAEGDSITYSLFGGVDQDKFSIDASSGELRFINAPDYEVPDDDGGDRIYEVRISASDSQDSSSMMLTVTITDVAEATDSVPLPTDFAATAGDANVTLTWTPSESDSTTYTIYRSSDSACEPTVANISTNCTAGAAFANEDSGFVDTGLSNGTVYHYWLEATRNGVTPRTTEPISATPEQPTASITPTGVLNDTGINWDGNYSSGNNTDCASSNISAPQDCRQGRDFTHNDDSNGHAGFSFTRLNADGSKYTSTGVYADDPWHCVQDNITGFIWEVKTDDDGLHDKDHLYTWYNTDPATNGGVDGYADGDDAICHGYDESNESTYCNTQAFAARVNTASLCGASDWRLPSKEELRSIFDYSRDNPSIDTNYFPNTVPSWFWSSSPDAGNSNYARLVYFTSGFDFGFNRSDGLYVRLVRSRP